MCIITTLAATQQNQSPNNPASPWTVLYLAGVRELTVHSFTALRILQFDGAGRLRALWLDGKFPELQSLSLKYLPKLRYLGAPYAGHAPKLRLTSDERLFHQLAELPSLRLLKIPGTAEGGTG